MKWGLNMAKELTQGQEAQSHFVTVFTSAESLVNKPDLLRNYYQAVYPGLTDLSIVATLLDNQRQEPADHHHSVYLAPMTEFSLKGFKLAGSAYSQRYQGVKS